MKHLPVLCRNAYFAPSVSRQLGSGHEPDLEQSVRFNQRRQDEINMFSRNHLSFSTLFLDKPRICIDIYIIIYILNIYYILTIYIYTICVDCLFRGYQQTVKKTNMCSRFCSRLPGLSEHSHGTSSRCQLPERLLRNLPDWTADALFFSPANRCFQNRQAWPRVEQCGVLWIQSKVRRHW